jgi:MazG family protein
MESKKNTFFSFCQTITQLRSPKGCPWDKKQTVQSLKKYISEECEELLQAMEENDPSHLCEEIGDVLFLLVLLTEISSESNQFTIEDVISGINAKMVRRHPHVFAGLVVETEEDLRKQWEKIKSREKAKKTN